MKYYGETDSWKHNFLHDAFTPRIDLAIYYDLNLIFEDDGSYGREYVFLDQPLAGGDRYFEVDSGTRDLLGSVAGLLQINSFGLPSISLTNKNGDFGFYGSVATLKGKSGHTPAPEPMTLAPFGLGITGMAITFFKKLTI